MSGPYSEAETRQEIIDKKLALAGWDVRDPSQVIQELDIELRKAGLPVGEERPGHPYEGHQFADYGLLLRGKPEAVVEAKRTSKDAQLGQEQALRYAENLQKIHGGPTPLVTYTNGYDIYYWESEHYPPVLVQGFPTPDDLEWLGQRRESRKPLSVELIDTGIAGRDYQIAAIRSLLEGIEAKKQKFLMVMATGTGKTRTAVALTDVLMRARWAKRVLFLVDRIALRDQALGAFKEFMPAEPRWPEPNEYTWAGNRRIYVTTYPTMLNLIQAGTSPDKWISPFFFDLVIADESHRSIYNTYRHVVDYFHGVKLGLTATPRDHVDHDTFRLFECDPGDPSFAYSYEEAVEHDPPYLCEFEVLKVRSKFQLEGIHGGTLPPPIQQKLTADGLDVEDIDFEGTDLERKVTNAPTNALIVREFMEECIKDPSGTLPGKTIIFAISKRHARRLQEIFDALYPEHRGRLARVLVSEDRFVYGKGGLLEQFKTSDMPRVAISVDMLDTGVDILEVVNLVFAKPVYSYVKFWQMIGRGTRILDAEAEKRKPWCTDKDRFLIIDCWGNFEYFDMHPEGREPGAQVPVPVRLFKARLDKLEVAFAQGATDVVETIKTDLRADIASLPQNNVVVAESEQHLATVRHDSYWERLRPEDLGYLRTVIAPVMRVRTDAEFKALRFETDVVELGTALLSRNEDAVEALKEAVRTQVDELPLSVNVVAKERALIDRVLREAWWKTATDAELRELVEKLGPLMKYRQRRKDPILKLEIDDALALKEHIEFGPEHERLSTAAYREKVEAYLRTLVAENPVLQKIQRGEEVSEVELRKLGDLLATQDPYITVDRLKQVYDARTAGFLQLLRHVLGLEVIESWSAEVTRAFDDFIARHNTYSALQIRFIQTVRTFVLQTGRLEKGHLIATPFTQIHPEGVRGLFRPSDIEEIMEFVDSLLPAA